MRGSLLFGRDSARTLNTAPLERAVQSSHAGRQNALPFICDAELFIFYFFAKATTKASFLCKWDKMPKYTCKNTEGKSSNNVVVGFCSLFICWQAEDLKLNSDGTAVTHADPKRGNS